MTMHAMISAADFLYSHSPARFVTAERNVILVAGDGGDALADALFELLFSTACRPGIGMELIRLVPGDAGQTELDFICRNAEGIGVFARHEFSTDTGRRPLTVRFADYDDESWRREPERLAWAVNLDTEHLRIPCAACFTSRDIPLLAPKRAAWSEDDEAGCAVLRIARRIHTAYTAGWDSRYTERAISETLYGAGGRDLSYPLRSSIRAAVSVPWKLAAAGIAPGPDAAERLYRKLAGDASARDAMAWQEHRSWLAFMVLEGWAMPTGEQMDAYFFRDGNDYRNLRERLHPCLADLADDDWNAPCPRSLRNLSVREWSEAAEHPEDFCRMDRISLEIHRRCREIVLSPAYRKRIDDLFGSLEAALVRSGPYGVSDLLGTAGLLRNMTDRLIDNETNSYSPWQHACGMLREALESAEDAALAPAKEVFGEILRETRVAAERNRCRDCREIDAGIVSRLPWVLSVEQTDTVWKLYSAHNRLENILSSIILRPRTLKLVCGEETLHSVPVDVFREILRGHGLTEVTVETVPASALPGGTVPCGPEGVIDVTGCGEMQNRLRLPADARIVYYGNDDLQDSAGSRFFAPLYHPYDFTMTVSEVIRLRGSELLSGTESNEMLGMERDYRTLWTASRAIRFMPGCPSAWHDTVAALRAAGDLQAGRAFRGNPAQARRFCHAVPPERTDRLAQSGAIGVLNRLQAAGCITDLAIDPDAGQVSFYYFPDPEGKGEEAYLGPARAFAEMLDDASEDADYDIVSDYVRHGEPLRFADRNRPLRLRAEELAAAILQKEGQRPDTNRLPPESRIRRGIGKLAEHGLLIPAEGKDEYRCKSRAVQRELEKEGFALEAFVYYTLFLSGRFDDIRSNVRIRTGTDASGGMLERELDILVTRKGRMGLISCKDTAHVQPRHIAELSMQAAVYGINARPVLVCTQELPTETREVCGMLNVGLITVVNDKLPARLMRLLSESR
ncbi:MAG: hypothetical protein IKS31_10735 [Clostridia bacterium]|nr:hypothetical protein [Clostridia bacterium]